MTNIPAQPTDTLELKWHPIHGILLLDKPKGISSNGILQKVKRLFKVKKAGHTGSLDPLATGMLPICFGEATKFSQYWLEADKCYLTTGCLGTRTDTGDSSGQIISNNASAFVEREKLEEALENFLGNIFQVPPMYSALKHAGKPLYQYARSGIHIERPPRAVNIKQINLKAFKYPYFSIEVACSKGTYIRTLVEDIGERLKVGAYVTELHRIHTNGFEKERIYTLDELEAMTLEERHSIVLPMDKALSGFKEVTLEDGERLAIQQGKTLKNIQMQANATEVIKLYTQDRVFLGLGKFDQDGALKAKRLLSC